MKKLAILLTLLVLSACGTTGSNNVASLYTGYEDGSWYRLSSTCSATLCPAY